MPSKTIKNFAIAFVLIGAAVFVIFRVGFLRQVITGLA